MSRYNAAAFRTCTKDVFGDHHMVPSAAGTVCANCGVFLLASSTKFPDTPKFKYGFEKWEALVFGFAIGVVVTLLAGLALFVY